MHKINGAFSTIYFPCVPKRCGACDGNGFCIILFAQEELSARFVSHDEARESAIKGLICFNVCFDSHTSVYMVKPIFIWEEQASSCQSLKPEMQIAMLLVSSHFKVLMLAG